MPALQVFSLDDWPILVTGAGRNIGAAGDFVPQDTNARLAARFHRLTVGTIGATRHDAEMPHGGVMRP